MSALYFFVTKSGTTACVDNLLAPAQGYTKYGAAFCDGTYYGTTEMAKYITVQSDTKNMFACGWGKAACGVVNSRYLRNGSQSNFARAGCCPTPLNTLYENGSSSMRVKYVSGTGIQIKKDGASSWTTLAGTYHSYIILVELCGGGGGGGGACGNTGSSVKVTNCAGGGGGGAGTYLLHAINLKNTGEIVLTRGSGGSAGSNGNDTNGGAGGNGGNSTLKLSSGTILCKATGGNGGGGGKIVTGSSEGGAWGPGTALTNQTYLTSSTYGHLVAYSLGAGGGTAAGGNETNGLILKGGDGRDNNANVGDLAPGGTQSGGTGGTASTGYINVFSGGGGGGASGIGVGGSRYPIATSNTISAGAVSPGAGGGGAGGYALQYNSQKNWLMGNAQAGANGKIGIYYQPTLNFDPS